MVLKFSFEEKKEILKAWVAISFAFGILISKSLNLQNLFENFFISFITVGIGFLFHELAHKFVAQKYKYFAEFRADNKMLVIAIISSFFGVLFAAPGGVIIQGGIDKEKYGKIACAGPLMNIIIAIIFLIISFSNNNLIKLIGSYGFNINSWLALFNLIPIYPFDGASVLKGSKKIYFSLLIFAGFFMILGYV